MPTVRLNIGVPPCMPAEFYSSIARMIHEHPPELPDGLLPSVRNVPPRGDAIEFDLIYPEPRPDIPALIKVWHLNPTEANRLSLWQAIYVYGILRPGANGRSCQFGDASYRAHGGSENGQQRLTIERA